MPDCAAQPACSRLVQAPSARYSMMPPAMLPAMPSASTICFALRPSAAPQSPTRSISGSSHFRVDVAGSDPGCRATIFCASVSATEICGRLIRSDAEQFCLARLDRLAFLLDRRGVVLHGLDVLQRRAPGLFLRLRMHRTQTPDIDDDLLCLTAQAEGLEQSCGVRMRRGLEDAVRSDDQRRAFRGIDRLDRAAGFLHLKNIV